LAAKNMVKSEFLNWLRGKSSISDPASSVVYEDMIRRIENGEFDKDRMTKVRIDCEFLQRVVSHVPYEENGNDESGEFIVYHKCSICDKEFPCLYPAKMCEYKQEMEDFINYIVASAEENINDVE